MLFKDAILFPMTSCISIKVSGTICRLPRSSLTSRKVVYVCIPPSWKPEKNKKTKGVFLVDESERRQQSGRQLGLFGVLLACACVLCCPCCPCGRIHATVDSNEYPRHWYWLRGTPPAQPLARSPQPLTQVRWHHQTWLDIQGFGISVIKSTGCSWLATVPEVG